MFHRSINNLPSVTACKLISERIHSAHTRRESLPPQLVFTGVCSCVPQHMVHLSKQMSCLLLTYPLLPHLNVCPLKQWTSFKMRLRRVMSYLFMKFGSNVCFSFLRLLPFAYQRMSANSIHEMGSTAHALWREAHNQDAHLSVYFVSPIRHLPSGPPQRFLPLAIHHHLCRLDLGECWTCLVVRGSSFSEISPGMGEALGLFRL